MIITYTSSQTSPIASQHDKVIDLASVNLPQTNIQLYGQAQDSNHPSASFLYSWSLSKPSGSSASLSSATVQNPILNNVDTWGNYRLFLIATNTSTGESSQTDAIIAPATSFVHVRVLSENKGLQKPSIGEKNWSTIYNDLVDEVEGFSGATSLNELSDVAISVPTNGQALRYDDILGEWKNQDLPTVPSPNLNVGANDVILPITAVDLANDKLSFHGTTNEIEVARSKVDNDVRITLSLPSSIIANASTATKLATARSIALSGAVSGSASFDGSAAITISTSSNITLPVSWITYSQQTTTTILVGSKDIGNTNITGVFNEGTLSKDFTDEIALHPHLIWRNNTGSSIKITYIDLVVFSGGSKDGGINDYTFDLVKCINDEGALAQNTWTSQSATISVLRSTNVNFKNHRPLPGSLDLSSNPITIGNGEWFGIRTLTHPFHHGYGLGGTITAYVV